MRFFNNSLVAFKDYLGSDSRQELLAVFNKHFPLETNTAAKKTKFDTYKIDTKKIKSYIDDAACSTEAIPVFEMLPASQATLIHWLRVSHTIHNNIKAQSVAFFISCIYVGSVLKTIKKINKKQVAEILGWPVHKLYRYMKWCTRIEQLAAAVGVAGAAALASAFTATDIDDVATTIWKSFLQKIAIDPEVRFLQSLTDDGFHIKY